MDRLCGQIPTGLTNVGGGVGDRKTLASRQTWGILLAALAAANAFKNDGDRQSCAGRVGCPLCTSPFPILLYGDFCIDPPIHTILFGAESVVRHRPDRFAKPLNRSHPAGANEYFEDFMLHDFAALLLFLATALRTHFDFLLVRFPILSRFPAASY